MQYAIQKESKALLAHRACHEAHRNNIFLIQAKDHTGYPAYYFLKVNPRREQLFRHVLKGKFVFDMEAFGEVIESGYGETVPEDIADRMRLEYGWCG